MSRKTGIPTYGRHAATNQARVIVGGKHIYLGQYGSEESKREYERIVRKHLGDCAAAEMKQRVEVSTDLRVIELVEAYLKFARGYYTKAGIPAPEYAHIYSALTPLREGHANDLVTTFGPLKLQAVREGWVKAKLVRGQSTSASDESFGCSSGA
jgi:hypothetical protein